MRREKERAAGVIGNGQCTHNNKHTKTVIQMSRVVAGGEAKVALVLLGWAAREATTSPRAA